MREVIVLFAALFGGGGIVALVLKRLWKTQDDATLAYQQGRKDEEVLHGQRLAEARAEVDRLRGALTRILASVEDPAVRMEVLSAMFAKPSDKE